MGEDLLPQHRIIDTVEDLSATQGSKYLPSRLAGVYREAAAEASRGRRVFFTGTPCQVAAFETFLKARFRDNVLSADVLCLGVPSAVAWQRHLEESFHGQVKEVRFRDKATGWETSSVKYTLKNGRTIYQKPSSDRFMAGFYTGAFRQSLCGDCPFAGLPRPGDLTLGDFWGVPEAFADRRGVSLVLASSSRGAHALQVLQEMHRITIFRSTLDIAAAANHRLLNDRCDQRSSPHREEIIRRLAAGDSLDSVAHLYLPGAFERALRRITPLLLWKIGKIALGLIRRSDQSRAEQDALRLRGGIHGYLRKGIARLRDF